MQNNEPIDPPWDQDLDNPEVVARLKSPLQEQNEKLTTEVERLRGLLSKWVSYMNLSGAKPVSGDVRDNPVLSLLKDSKDALRNL